MRFRGIKELIITRDLKKGLLMKFKAETPLLVILIGGAIYALAKWPKANATTNNKIATNGYVVSPVKSENIVGPVQSENIVERKVTWL